MQVNIYDAKAQLSQLVERALAGEEIVIAKAGTPLVTLTPVCRGGERMLGAARGQYHLAEDWDRPMTDEEYEAFLNRGAL